MRWLALAVWFMGCLFMGGVAQAQLGTFTTYTTTWNNLTRTYSVYLPPALQPTPALVLALHGTAITTQSEPPLTACTKGMEWDATADANGFVLVCPIATYIPGSPSGRFLWDSYGLDSYFPAPPDDSGFLRSLILQMQQPTSSGGFGTDPNRTFVMGFSSGAMMTQRECIENADVVSACAIASGTLWAASQAPTVPAPSQPVSILELHGDADPTLEYCGGPWTPVPNEPALTVKASKYSSSGRWDTSTLMKRGPSLPPGSSSAAMDDRTSLWPPTPPASWSQVPASPGRPLSRSRRRTA